MTTWFYSSPRLRRTISQVSGLWRAIVSDWSQEQDCSEQVYLYYDDKLRVNMVRCNVTISPRVPGLSVAPYVAHCEEIGNAPMELLSASVAWTDIKVRMHFSKSGKTITATCRIHDLEYACSANGAVVRYKLIGETDGEFK